MSIRIHEIAKRYNMEGKDMLALLKERGYVAADTKSVSSTVSKIYVDEIEKELGPKMAAAVAVAPVVAKAPAPVVAEEPEQAASVAVSRSPDETAPSKVRLPAGVFVKTADDIA